MFTRKKKQDDSLTKEIWNFQTEETVILNWRADG
jgi:hypothetical protein